MVPIVMPGSKANASLWAEAVEVLGTERQPVTGSKFDIAIIGGGFSGLWSAFNLINLDPNLKVAIFEARTFGFGASGRNGGWASSEYPVSRKTLTQRIGESATERLFEALNLSIEEIGKFSSQYGDGVGFTKSGSLYFARNAAQLARLKKKTISGENLLSGAEVKALLDIEGVLGGIFDPECATIHPYNLVLALTRYLSSRSVSLFEGALATPAPGGVLVNSSFINAEIVIQATEVFGRPGRDFIPLYSLMVATEPLSAATWEKLGNPNRFTFAEASHMINYAQRTPDNRIAIGGRGATYPFGSRLRDRKEHDGQVHDRLKQLLRSWFPELEQVQFTHAWGGAVAITRDWEPYVQWHPEMKFARLGGYAGDGVTMSHLAAKILAHEILDRDCELRSLHFVNRTIRPWEVEPLRYLGVNAMVKLSGIADKEEQITKRASLLNRVIEPLILR